MYKRRSEIAENIFGIAIRILLTVAEVAYLSVWFLRFTVYPGSLFNFVNQILPSLPDICVLFCLIVLYFCAILHPVEIRNPFKKPVSDEEDEYML